MSIRFGTESRMTISICVPEKLDSVSEKRTLKQIKVFFTQLKSKMDALVIARL